MEASAINEPHPDDVATEPAQDEADLFFGDPETEEQIAASPDPSTFNPESGTFDTPPGGEAHQGETPGDPSKAAPDPTPAVEAGTTGSTGEATDPTPPSPNTSAEPPTPSTSGEPAGQTTTAPAASGGQTEKKGGNPEREYLVFHKVALTAPALKFLLGEIEAGNAPEPRVAYLRLHRSSTRKVESAIIEAYNEHKEALGEKCELAGVSERSFQERHVEPKQRIETNVSLS